ncbi:MAG: hypothetical protein FD153_1239 [Rhodospirillaceae bacterium]|nr:MAG: hypothetical protein FD153_1239 [Rhodospirillaceae bacterium]
MPPSILSRRTPSPEKTPVPPEGTRPPPWSGGGPPMNRFLSRFFFPPMVKAGDPDSVMNPVQKAKKRTYWWLRDSSNWRFCFMQGSFANWGLQTDRHFRLF